MSTLFKTVCVFSHANYGSVDSVVSVREKLFEAGEMGHDEEEFALQCVSKEVTVATGKQPHSLQNVAKYCDLHISILTRQPGWFCNVTALDAGNRESCKTYVICSVLTLGRNRLLHWW